MLATTLASIWAEDRVQPDDGFPVVFSPAADVADIRWKIWYGYQFVIQPSEIGQVPEFQYASLAFNAQSFVLVWHAWRRVDHSVSGIEAAASWRICTAALEPRRVAPAFIIASAVL